MQLALETDEVKAEPLGIGVLEWREADELNHLAEFCQVLRCMLNFPQTIANCVCLMNHLKDCIAHGALMEQEINHSHRESWRLQGLEKSPSLLFLAPMEISPQPRELSRLLGGC
jgi:hypothetical protein